MRMQEQLVSFETAKLAKKKGFNLNSHAFYGCDNPSSGRESNQLILREWENWVNFGNEDSPQEGTAVYSAPTQSLLQKWLREVHKIHIEIRNYQEYQKDNYAYTLNFTKESNYLDKDGNKIGQIISRKYYNDYEEALEIGLQEALKLIK